MIDKKRIILAATAAFFTSASITSAQDLSPHKHTAALSEFNTNITQLEKIVDDIAIAGALAILAQADESWDMGATAGFDSAISGISSDLHGVTSNHQYRLTKLRSTIYRNGAATDEQRETALALFTDIEQLITEALSIGLNIDAGDTNSAARFRDDILHRADELTQQIDALSEEIVLAIKLSAL